MSYCTIDDLVKAASAETLIQLTDDTGSGVYDSAVLNAEIQNATDEINAYCQKRYADSLPFATVPGIIKMLCIDIAVYRVAARRGRLDTESTISKKYEAAVRKLEGIAKGLIDLGSSAVVEDEISFTGKTPEDRKFKDPQGYS